MSWLDITQDLTEKGQNELMVGQVLMFKKGTKENNLKIMRKRHGKVWAKFVHMYHPDQVHIEDKLED